VQKVHALFSIIAKIAAEEAKKEKNNMMFAELFGVTVGDTETCDFVSLLESLRQLYYTSGDGYTGDGHSRLIQMAERHEKGYTAKWIRKHLTVREAGLLHSVLSRHPEMIWEFLCKIPSGVTAAAAGAVDGAAAAVDGAITAYIPMLLFGLFAPADYVMPGTASVKPAQAFIDNIVENSEAIKHAKTTISTVIKDMMKMLPPTSHPRPIMEVSQLLNEMLNNPTDDGGAGRLSPPRSNDKKDSPGAADSNNLTALLELIEPYIYRQTPMTTALVHAKRIFYESHDTQQRILVIVSDGESTDGDPIPVAKTFTNTYIVTCFLTDGAVQDSKQLFDRPQQNWSKGEKVLFEMSSTMGNLEYPLSLLGRARWNLPPSGQSRLFLRANNLDVVNEFCDMLISNLPDAADTLLDIIGNYDLDQYINALNKETNGKKQKGGTCYANAIGFVFYLAMKRVVGRKVPEFPEILAKLVEKYSENGAATAQVLEKEVKNYRLRYREVNEEDARIAINRRRPVVATFRLEDGPQGGTHQWQKFGAFFHEKAATREGILKREHIGEPSKTDTMGGHAVILVRCSPLSLTFMNSWGDQWGSGGNFSIENAEVLSNKNYPMRFFDVFWTEADLLKEEKEAYEEQNKEQLKKYSKKYSSIGNLTLSCPHCNVAHPINQYTGHCLKAKCPRCGKEFKPTGNDLLRHLYNRQYQNV
jgi:hypothetical protein